MPKIRSLKGDYFRSADISRCGIVAKVLGAGLITAVADDEGRFKALPDYLRGEIFTHDPVTDEEVLQALLNLESVQFIRLYQLLRKDNAAQKFPNVPKKTKIFKLGVLLNWTKHQMIPPSRFTESNLPPPPDTTEFKNAQNPHTDRKQTAGMAHTDRKQTAGIPHTDRKQTAGMAQQERKRKGKEEENNGDRVILEKLYTKEHGDNVYVGASGHAALKQPRSHARLEEAAAAALVVPVDPDVTALCTWFLDHRGWATFASLDQAAHERQVARQMLQLFQLFELTPLLDAWWRQTDPDDRPSSLEYFWRRLQDEHHAARQQPRSHARLDSTLDSALTKITPRAPAPPAPPPAKPQATPAPAPPAPPPAKPSRHRDWPAREGA